MPYLKKWLNEWYVVLKSCLWYLITIVVIGLIYYRELFLFEQNRNISLSQELSGAEVTTLSTELNPHFLFNAMNGIAMQIRKKENSQAIESIADLGEMLRAVLSTGKEVYITVEEELKLLDHYISLEKRRFGEKVEISIEHLADVSGVFIPKLLLQPIVENSFKHGLNSNEGMSKIHVSLALIGKRLVINIFNTSTDRSIWSIQSGKSIGLPNTVERLRKLYQEDYSFQIRQNDTGVLVTIELPIRT